MLGNSSQSGFGRGRAWLDGSGDGAAAPRRTSVGTSALSAGKGDTQSRQPLRRPKIRHPALLAPETRTEGCGNRLSAVASTSSTVDVSRSPLNPDSDPFVPRAVLEQPARPAAAVAVDGTWCTPAAQATAQLSPVKSESSISSLNSFTAVPDLSDINMLLFANIQETDDHCQVMVYNNILDVLSTLSYDPASFDTIGTTLVDNLVSWLESSGIQCVTIVKFLFNQTACVPSFAYICARMCNRLCYELSGLDPPFRSVLLLRCKELFDHADSQVPVDVKSYGQVLMLFCELYLNVTISHEVRVFVLGNAVLAMLDKLLTCVTAEHIHYINHALKLTGAALNQCADLPLDATMSLVREAAVDSSLPQDCASQLLKLVTRHAAGWETASSGLQTPPDRRICPTYVGLSPEMDQFLEDNLVLSVGGSLEDDQLENDELYDAYDEFLKSIPDQQ